MIEFGDWIRQTALAVWVGESAIGFPLALILHAVGMAFVAGFHFSMDARLLGFAPSIRPAAFNKLLPFVWLNVVLIAVSGVMLLTAFPARVLTNSVFYLKMLLLVFALLLTQPLRRACGGEHGTSTFRIKLLASLSIVLWVSIIVAGRLLAYTHNRFI